MWPDWHLPPDTMPLTAGQAQARQDEARARQGWLTWFVGPATDANGAVMARAHTADFQGGVLLPSGLIATTLDELRQMMPVGLVREDRSAWDPPEIIETWWD
ncbi:MAG: hypothetical protein ACRYGM_07205 [Janthinobacterium lividum]